MPASSWSRSATSTASSWTSRMSTGPSSPRPCAATARSSHPGRAWEPMTEVVNGWGWNGAPAPSTSTSIHRTHLGEAIDPRWVGREQLVLLRVTQAALAHPVGERAQQECPSRECHRTPTSSPVAPRPDPAPPGQGGRPRPPIPATEGCRWARSSSGSPGRTPRRHPWRRCHAGTSGPPRGRRGTVRCGPGRAPPATSAADLLQGTGPPFAVGEDGAAGHATWAICRGLEDDGVARGGPAVAAGDLDDPRPMRRPADDGTVVVQGIDTLGDVRHE